MIVILVVVVVVVTKRRKDVQTSSRLNVRTEVPLLPMANTTATLSRGELVVAITACTERASVQPSWTTLQVSKIQTDVYTPNIEN